MSSSVCQDKQSIQQLFVPLQPSHVVTATNSINPLMPTVAIRVQL